MIGRKWVLLSSSLFFVLAYILMLIASEVWIIYLARLIQVNFYASLCYANVYSKLYIGFRSWIRYDSPTNVCG